MMQIEETLLDPDPETSAHYWSKLEQHRQEMKRAPPAWKFTVWYEHSVLVRLDDVEQCNRHGRERQEMTSKVAKDRKQSDDRSPEDIHIIGVKGEAAWSKYLGIPMTWQLRSGGAWLHDITIQPGKTIEVKTKSAPYISPYISLYKGDKTLRSPAYALALPNRYVKNAADLDAIILVGWCSRKRFESKGRWMNFKNGEQWSICAHDLMAPHILRQHVKEINHG